VVYKHAALIGLHVVDDVIVGTNHEQSGFTHNAQGLSLVADVMCNVRNAEFAMEFLPKRHF
jgi:hypothetical protein